jgi:hypothetical protein
MADNPREGHCAKSRAALMWDRLIGLVLIRLWSTIGAEVAREQAVCARRR